MKLYRYIAERRRFGGPTVVSIGNFDGVHRGHQSVIRLITARAREHGVPAVVVTFEPHAQEFFNGGEAPPRLMRLAEKVSALASAGVETVVALPFNAAVAAMSPQAFIDDVLCRDLRVAHLVVGDDFRFGRDRAGDFDLLVEAGGDRGFTVERRDPYLVDGERVSSSAVRDALAVGDLQRAGRLLGRPYMMCGRVVGGEQRGRTIGFPTANVHLRRARLPLQGVFAVAVEGADGGVRPAVANIGWRPTVGTLRPLLEVHLLDFRADLYSRRIRVTFLHRLRAERRFESLDALRTQIDRDVEAARAFFANAGALRDVVRTGF